MPRRHRVYLTLSVKDADMLGDLLEQMLLTGETHYGHDNADARVERIMNRLRELTDSQRPSLVEDMIDGPPDDYDPDQGGT